MAVVELQFLAPDTEDIETLFVEEAATQDGPFSEIQSFAAGTFPDYITSCVVNTATSVNYWFRIRWVDTNGFFTPYSDPVQGGTTTVVSQIRDRVLLRDSSVDSIVAGQESEICVSDYFNVDDPYSVSPSLATPKILGGLTLLTLARVYTLRLIEQGNTEKWSAGLVSMQISTGTGEWKQIEHIIALANKDLNRNYSAVFLMKEVSVAGGFKQLKVYDVSRSLIELA